MELRTIVSKRAYLFSLVYDLFHVPGLLEDSHLYVYNMGDFSKALYTGYMLEKRGLWAHAVQELVGIGTSGSRDVEELMGVLDGINVFGWEFIEEELKILANRVMEIYGKYRGRIIREVSRILGVEEYYGKVYLVVGFNPLKGMYGSLVYGRDPGYAVVSVFVRPDMNAARVVDLLLHEVLHGLIRVNGIQVPDEVEEEFVDALCPEGFLSNLLGLSGGLVVGEGRLQHLVRDYFGQKLYEKGVKLPDFIRQALGSQYKYKL